MRIIFIFHEPPVGLLSVSVRLEDSAHRLVLDPTLCLKSPLHLSYLIVVLLLLRSKMLVHLSALSIEVVVE